MAPARGKRDARGAEMQPAACSAAITRPISSNGRARPIHFDPQGRARLMTKAPAQDKGAARRSAASACKSALSILAAAALAASGYACASSAGPAREPARGASRPRNSPASPPRRPRPRRAAPAPAPVPSRDAAAPRRHVGRAAGRFRRLADRRLQAMLDAAEGAAATATPIFRACASRSRPTARSPRRRSSSIRRPIPAWKPHAEAALSAVKSCDPLHVPDKYAPYYPQWKTEDRLFRSRSTLTRRFLIHL